MTKTTKKKEKLVEVKPIKVSLTQAEEFFIAQNPRGLSLAKLAEEMGKDVELIRPHFHVKDGFGHRKGSTIMTPGASEAGDEFGRANRGRVSDAVKNKTCIHNCRKRG